MVVIRAGYELRELYQDANRDHHTGEKLLNLREFSFTLENDTYIRYQSFRDAQEMKSSMSKRQPHKIDIGAVFSISVRQPFISYLVFPYCLFSSLKINRRYPTQSLSRRSVNWCSMLI